MMKILRSKIDTLPASIRPTAAGKTAQHLPSANLLFWCHVDYSLNLHIKIPIEPIVRDVCLVLCFTTFHKPHVSGLLN